MYEDAAKYCGASISTAGDLSYVTNGSFAWPQMIYLQNGSIQQNDLQLLSKQIVSGTAPRTLLIGELHLNEGTTTLLRANRFMKASEWINMYLSLESFQPASAPLSMEILEVSEKPDGELQHWLSIVSNVLFNGKELSSDFFVQGIRKGFLKLFLAKTNGKAAATTLLYCGKDTAGVYMVATLPEYQRLGLGKAIMKSTIQKAAEATYSTVVLQSTSEGLPLYKSLGFQMCNKLAIYFSLLKNQEG